MKIWSALVVTLLYAGHAVAHHAEAVFDQPVTAPIAKGQTLGKLVITAPGMTTKEIPLVSAQAVTQLGFMDRFFAKLHLLLHK